MADAKTSTPQLEQLRQSQIKKKTSVDPAHILDKAIYQLWDTINDLDQIQPERVEHYRVSVFGSSRIERGDPIYEEVKKLCYDLSHMGIDIVTGGGPGLMEAANAGAVEGQIESHSRSFGLAIHLPNEEGANPFVNKVFRHRTFFSRLHHFVRMSQAFLVFPGGIGTALESFMTWQLVQVGMLRERPVVFVGAHWRGLCEWMRGTVLEGGYINPRDFDLVRLVEDPAEAVAVVAEAKAAFDARRPPRILKPLRGATE